MGLAARLSSYEAHQFFKRRHDSAAAAPPAAAAAPPAAAAAPREHDEPPRTGGWGAWGGGGGGAEEEGESALSLEDFRALVAVILAQLHDSEGPFFTAALEAARALGQQEPPAFPYAQARMAAEARADFAATAEAMAALFLSLGAEQAALDMVQLALTSALRAERYLEAEEQPIELALESLAPAQLAALLAAFADGALRLARQLLAEDRKVRVRRAEVTRALEEATAREEDRLAAKMGSNVPRVEVKARTGGSSFEERGKGALLAAEFAADAERWRGELEALRLESEEALAELRWLRKRAHVTLAIATRALGALSARARLADLPGAEDGAREARAGAKAARAVLGVEGAVALLTSPELMPESKWRVLRGMQLQDAGNRSPGARGSPGARSAVSWEGSVSPVVRNPRAPAAAAAAQCPVPGAPSEAKDVFAKQQGPAGA